MGRRIDTGRLRNLVSGPGVDTRYLLTLAVVDKVVVDPQEGVFCDIALLPFEQPETARLGVPYAGNGFGFYFPVEVDDVVLVAVPDGDFGSGAVIISRMWSAADPPLAEAQGAADTDSGPGQYEGSPNVTLRAKAGAHTKIIVSSGANVTIQVEGNGTINLNAASGDINLETAASGNINLKVATGSVNLANNSHGPLDGVVHGSGFDTFTGVTYTALGNASQKVFAKKS